MIQKYIYYVKPEMSENQELYCNFALIFNDFISNLHIYMMFFSVCKIILNILFKIFDKDVC